MATGTSKPLRADALRSRELIVDAAAEIFGRDGADASLEEIARSAGVGSATLHRHFPSRWILLEAVFAERVRALRDAALDGPDGDPPRAALVAWLRSVYDYCTDTRGLAAALLQAEPRTTGGSCQSTLADASRALLERAQRAGEVRHDITTDDVLTLVAAVATATEHDSGRGELLFDVVIDGLSASSR